MMPCTRAGQVIDDIRPGAGDRRLGLRLICEVAIGLGKGDDRLIPRSPQFRRKRSADEPGCRR